MKISTHGIATYAVMFAVIVAATLIDKAYSYALVNVGGASLAVCSLIATATCGFLFDKFTHSLVASTMFGFASFVLAYIFLSLIFQNPLASLLPRVFIGPIGLLAYRLARITGKRMNAFAVRTHMGYVLPSLFTAAVIAGMVVFIVFNANGGWVFFAGLSAFVLGLLLGIGVILAVASARHPAADGRRMEHFSLAVGTFFMVLFNTLLVLPMMMLLSEQYSTLADVYAALTVINFLPELTVTVAVAPFVIAGVRRGLRLGVDGHPRKKRRTDEPVAAQVSEKETQD